MNAAQIDALIEEARNSGNGITITQRREAMEERLPQDVDPALFRRFVPGDWVYELEHADGRIEPLSEDEYRLFRSALTTGIRL